MGDGTPDDRLPDRCNSLAVVAVVPDNPPAPTAVTDWSHHRCRRTGAVHRDDDFDVLARHTELDIVR